MWPHHFNTTPLNFCFIYLFFFSRKKVTDYNPALNSYEHFSNDEGIMLSPLTPQIGKMKFILSDTLLLHCCCSRLRILNSFGIRTKFLRSNYVRMLEGTFHKHTILIVTYNAKCILWKMLGEDIQMNVFKQE